MDKWSWITVYYDFCNICKKKKNTWEAHKHSILHEYKVVHPKLYLLSLQVFHQICFYCFEVERLTEEQAMLLSGAHPSMVHGSPFSKSGICAVNISSTLCYWHQEKDILLCYFAKKMRNDPLMPVGSSFILMIVRRSHETSLNHSLDYCKFTFLDFTVRYLSSTRDFCSTRG